MRYHQVRPGRQKDANREFEEPARIELQLFVIALIVFTVIAFLSL
jgi:hypothetical protein